MKGLLDARSYFQANCDKVEVLDALRVLEQNCLQISSLERQTQPQITDVFKPK